MIERLKEIFQQYPNRIMEWYAGLDFFYQCGVLFLLIVAGLMVVSYVILSRVTR